MFVGASRSRRRRTLLRVAPLLVVLLTVSVLATRSIVRAPSVGGGRRRSNIRVMNSSAISFFDLTLRGANPNGGTSSDAYNPIQEHQHGFDMLSVNGVTLVNVTVTDVYGDFVYLARMPGQPATSNVLISESTFARSGRQGITLTAAHDVTIGRNSISDVAGATIDLEPSISDVVDDVTIASNDLSGQAVQVWAENPLPGRRDNWTVAGNISDLSFGAPTAR